MKSINISPDLESRRWLSPREASKYLGCHLMTIYSWLDAGVISGARLGRKVLIDRRRLDEQLEAQATAAKCGAKR